MGDYLSDLHMCGVYVCESVVASVVRAYEYVAAYSVHIWSVLLFGAAFMGKFILCPSAVPSIWLCVDIPALRLAES